MINKFQVFIVIAAFFKLTLGAYADQCEQQGYARCLNVRGECTYNSFECQDTCSADQQCFFKCCYHGYCTFSSGLCDDDTNTVMIIAIVVPVAFVFVICIIVSCCICRRAAQRRKILLQQQQLQMNGANPNLLNQQFAQQMANNNNFYGYNNNMNGQPINQVAPTNYYGSNQNQMLYTPQQQSMQIQQGVVFEQPNQQPSNQLVINSQAKQNNGVVTYM